MEWEVDRFHPPHSLSAQDFVSRIESRNIPVLFEGSVTAWPAYVKWQPHDGGLDYLKCIASDATVQVMLSTSDGNFYGDIRSHERMALSFGEYLDYASEFMDCDKKDKQSSEGQLLDGMQLYLAQVPIFSKEQQESSPLKMLLQDITMPKYLNSLSITNINLWMSALASKSSTHYDPFHNVLCVLAGTKQVTLWPPSATPFLYPYPVHGEASNHSSVDFVKPNTLLHPHFEQAYKYSRAVTLQPGDALFIPEGWYHQVDSDSLTIGVNLWWPSTVMSMLGSHMDGYYLRRVVSSLLDSEKERIIGLSKAHLLQKEQANDSETDIEDSSIKRNDSYPTLKQSEQSPVIKKKESKCSAEKEWQISIDILTPLQKHFLKTLILSCTSEDMIEDGKKSGKDEYIHEGHASSYPQRTIDKTCKIPFSISKEDPTAHVFSILDPLSLKQVLSSMVLHFPKTLEMLVLHKLSPMAAELLTRKFDEMDKLCSEVDQAQFYKSFYSVFEDSKMAMSSFLDGKEAFAAEALHSVLQNYLGL